MLVSFVAFLVPAAVMVCLFAIKVLYRAPSSTLADTDGISSTLWPLRYNVTTSPCGLFLVGRSSFPGGGTRVPRLYLVGDVVAY